MGKRAAGLIVTSILLLGLVASIAWATPGQLDPTFSGDGRSLVDFGGQDEASDLALTPDGGYVAVGFTYATDDAVVMKLKADGSQDTTFAGTGAFKSKFGQVRGYANAVAVRPDGRIVVVGEAQHSYPNPRDIRVFGLLPDGTTDPDTPPETFTSPEDINPTDMALAPDGKIVIAGTVYGTDNDIFVMRLKANGTLDPSFSGDGKMTLLAPTTDDTVEGVAVQPDGKIVITGETGTSLSSAMFVGRIGADGTVDSSFGISGFTLPNFGGAAFGEEVAIQPDGKIVAVGGRAPDNMSPADSFAVARLLPGGTPDPAFSGDGLFTTSFGGGQYTYANGVALQQNGKVVVGGKGGPGNDFALLRLDAAGNPDSGFGPDGKLTIDFGSTDGIDHGLLVGPDGDIVAAGTGGPLLDFAFARIEGDPPVGPGPTAACAGKTATITGTKGRDVLKGTKGRDVIAGLGGNDKIYGFAGNDLICGGTGKDKIFGGKGRDTLVGQGGADLLRGGPGKDKLKGGPGRDRQHQ